ncbi:MAG: Ig-like domain-containing protein, partial [Bacteroidales bacterium]
MKLIPEETVRHFCDQRIRLVIIALLLVLGLFSCANPVAPTGGPVDEEPPQVVRSTPENYATNFQGGQVRIYFDEYVQLRDINNKLLISPPLETMPEIRLRGRSIIMNIEEELRPNTTYNFFFGDAIVDITENNPMLNFQFVVATGDFVDSLSVMGQVLDAFTLAPMEEGTYVMLYDEYYDSIPYKEKPVYLSKTNAEGDFWIHNMREGEFKVFALQDLNSNFIYDLPEERIAFLDSLVTPTFDFLALFFPKAFHGRDPRKRLPAAPRAIFFSASRIAVVTADHGNLDEM